MLTHIVTWLLINLVEHLSLSLDAIMLPSTLCVQVNIRPDYLLTSWKKIRSKMLTTWVMLSSKASA
jgi:hypothetical protein